MHRIHSGLTVAVAVREGYKTKLEQVLNQFSASLNKSSNSSSNTNSNLRSNSSENSSHNPGSNSSSYTDDNTINNTNINLSSEVSADAIITNNCICNFETCESTLFVSCVIIREQAYKNEMLPETFIFATTFSGPFDKHLNELIDTNHQSLCAIFENCKDFPADAVNNSNSLLKFLKCHRHEDTFNSRYNCKTKVQIQQEKELRNEIEDYLDNAQPLVNLNALAATEVKTLIQRHIKSRGQQFEWAHKADKKSLIEELEVNRFWYLSILLLEVLALIFSDHIFAFLITLFSIILVFVLLGALAVFYITRKTFPTASRPDDCQVRSLAASQLRPVINEMTAAAPLKDGRIRRNFYALALKVTAMAFRAMLEIPTVSNIRWLVIDKKRRLLFLSAFTNTTDFYVRDFLTGSTWQGVNFMFTNGHGFPDAKYLFKEGITKDPEGYMDVIHTHQHITHLWYAHDYNVTADIINRNSKIRNGLFKPMTEKETREWLMLL